MLLLRLPMSARWTLSVPLSVHYAIDRRFVFQLNGLPPGDYRLAFRLVAERDDLDDDDVLPARTVKFHRAFAPLQLERTRVRVPGRRDHGVGGVGFAPLAGAGHVLVVHRASERAVGAGR